MFIVAVSTWEYLHVLRGARVPLCIVWPAASSSRSDFTTLTNVLINGTWGQSSTPRFLANGRGFEAENSGRQVGLGAGDRVFLRFNQPLGSDAVPLATKADIDRVFSFSPSIGLDYVGLWEVVPLESGGSDYQATITILTPVPMTPEYRSMTRVGGVLSVTVLPAGGLRALDLSGAPSR